MTNEDLKKVVREQVAIGNLVEKLPKIGQGVQEVKVSGNRSLRAVRLNRVGNRLVVAKSKSVKKRLP